MAVRGRYRVCVYPIGPWGHRRVGNRIEHGRHEGIRPCDRHDEYGQDQQTRKRSPEFVETAVRHRGYFVILPIVAISSSTLCRCSTTSPDANASATQWDT